MREVRLSNCAIGLVPGNLTGARLDSTAARQRRYHSSVVPLSGMPVRRTFAADERSKVGGIDRNQHD